MTNTPERNPLKEDFRKFLFVVWRHLGLPDPTPVQYDIARYLQHGPRRKMIMAYRGVGKSWIYAAFVCWRLYCNPDWKIMVVSASKPLADSFSTFVKRLIAEMELLHPLRPQEGQRDSNIAFDVGPARASKDPSVKSVGIMGQITGSRADEIIADDIEVPNNSATQMMREKLAELVKEFDAVLKPGGVITYLGTPQTEQTIYNILPERGYEIRVWTVRVPKDGERYKGRLAPFIQKMIDEGVPALTPVDPKRFSEVDLQEREASYGRSGFALQFMLDTSLSDSDRYPLKVSDFIVMSLDRKRAPVETVWCGDPDKIVKELPNVAFSGDRFYGPAWISKDYAEYQGAVMFIDPAGRGKDETGYAVVKTCNGTLYVTACGGFLGGYDDQTLSALARIAKEHEVKLVLIESNFGDGMFAKLIQPVLKNAGYPVTIEEIRAKTNKEARIIETLEPVMNQHRLVIDSKVIRDDFESTPDLKYQLIYQLTRITKDRGSLIHDDRLDALAGAVGYWWEAMARDQKQAAQEARQSALDEELQRFMEHTLGRPKGNDPMRWMSI